MSAAAEEVRRLAIGSFLTKTRLRKAMQRYGMSHGEFLRAAAQESLMLLEDCSVVLVQRWLDERNKFCVNHNTRPVREILDGEPLCASCCDAWARGEGLFAAEMEQAA